MATYKAYQPPSSTIPLQSAPNPSVVQSRYDKIPEAELSKHVDRDYTLKRNIRYLKVVVRFATLGLAIYSTYVQALTLHKFLTTRTIIRNNRNPWAAQTTIWPTILLLTTSSITVLISLLTVLSYCRSIRHANKTQKTAGTTATLVEFVAHLAVWIATASAYRVGKTGQDLWGWSCSEKAQTIQKTFEEVDFQSFCNTQSYSWYVSICQVALAVVIITVWVLAYMRMKRNRKLERQNALLAGDVTAEEYDEAHRGWWSRKFGGKGKNKALAPTFPYEEPKKGIMPRFLFKNQRSKVPDVESYKGSNR